MESLKPMLILFSSDHHTPPFIPGYQFAKKRRELMPEDLNAALSNAYHYAKAAEANAMPPKTMQQKRPSAAIRLLERLLRQTRPAF